MTRLRKIHNKLVLQAYKHGFIWQKLQYFIQSNNLYTRDEVKTVVNSEDNGTQRLSRVQLSISAKYKKTKNEFGDTILQIWLIKSGSVLDSNLADFQPKLEALFNGPVLTVIKERQWVEYDLLYKPSKEPDEFILDEPVSKAPENSSTQPQVWWQYKKAPHMLISGNSGTGKNYLLFSIVRKMMGETDPSNIYIADGKFDELAAIAKDWRIPNIAENNEEIGEFIHRVNDEMERRYQNQVQGEAIFLVIDEFAALQLTIDKKDWQELNKTIKNIILKGRAANVHVLIALQRASSESIDLAIRDNTAVKIGLGNLSPENFKMVFGESRNQNDLINRNIGEGYIKIDGENLALFESPTIRRELGPEA